jgi:Ca2+-dependent lipid-binding protein
VQTERDKEAYAERKGDLLKQL